LAGGEIGDLDVEVKWGCPCEEFCPGGDGCVLEVEVMERTRIRAEELLLAYAAGERDFSGLSLGGELIDADLQGINLSETDCDCTSLFRCDLSGANLSQAYLSGHCLEYSNFTNANLSETSLEQSSFDFAILRGANLRQARLAFATLRNADLTGANLTGADLRATDLTGADLTNANLTGATARPCVDKVVEDAILSNTIGPEGQIWNN
jgi:uncharacterized protein YjbI with pentapeptide repeats